MKKTKMMKQIFTLLAITIGMTVSAQTGMSDNSDGTSATGANSVAMGKDTTASGNYSTAMGWRSEATGTYTTAMGVRSKATGLYATAMGASSASGLASTAMGSSNSIGAYSTSMNALFARGDFSTAMGFGTTASDYGSLVIGQYNLSGDLVTNSATAFNTANTAFVIGNGVDADNKSDTFKVLFNGDATVGNDLTVSGDVVVNSDMRLKANIATLGATLIKLLQIDGKTYTMKRDATKNKR